MCSIVGHEQAEAIGDILCVQCLCMKWTKVFRWNVGLIRRWFPFSNLLHFTPSSPPSPLFHGAIQSSVGQLESDHRLLLFREYVESYTHRSGESGVRSVAVRTKSMYCLGGTAQAQASKFVQQPATATVTALILHNAPIRANIKFVVYCGARNVCICCTLHSLRNDSIQYNVSTDWEKGEMMMGKKCCVY